TYLHSLSRRLPNFFASLLVERNDERSLAVILVSLHDHEVVEEDQRRRRAHSESRDISDLRFPRELAFEVVSVEPFSAEERVDHLAVGRGRRCSVRTLAVSIVVRCAFPCGLLPDNLTGIAIDRNHFESVLLVRADTVRMNKFFVTQHVLRRLGAWNLSTFDSSCQENHFAPNDRRRMRSSVDRSLPLDVFSWAPFGGEVLLGRDAGAVGTSPLRPVPC